MRTVGASDVRGYWDRRPCNVRHGTAPPGSPEWSAQVTARKYFVEPHIPGFAQFARWSGKRVLEIGCGIGTDTLEFAKAGAVVDAVDLSLASLKLAAQRLPRARYPNVRLFHMNAEEHLPYNPEGYDLVYSFGVLHHMARPEQALQLAHWCLKSSGELRVMVYARRSLKSLLGEQPEAQAGCPLARRYSRNEARYLLEEEGFKVSSIRRRHIFPWRIADYVEHRYVKRWYLRWLPAWALRALERILGDHLLIVARPVAASGKRVRIRRASLREAFA